MPQEQEQPGTGRREYPCIPRLARIRDRRNARATIFCAAVLLLPWLTFAVPSYAQRPVETINQDRINEWAAACLTAQMAMSGLKGVPKPTETPGQFHARIRGYFAALDQLNRSLQPLRSAPPLRDRSRSNVALWNQIVSDVNRLPVEIKAAQQEWNRPPPVTTGKRESHARSRLGEMLLVVLNTVQAILNGLRDARA